MKPQNIQADTQRRQKVLLIGDLAKLTGRSEHTIRWYEAQRLMPGVRRDLQRRRTYVQGHVSWLDHLDRLRRAGMSIRELREYTAMAKRGDATLKERQELLQAHRLRIESTIHDLQTSLRMIDSKIDFYGLWLATGRKPAHSQTKERISS